jgi:hypothetical protein
MRAAVVMTPGVTILFDKAAMASFSIPIFDVLSGTDEVLRGCEQADREYLQATTTTFAEFSDAGH